MNWSIQQAISAVMPNAIATGLLVSLCSIQAPPIDSFDAGGAPTGALLPVAGLQNIPCMAAPLSTGSEGANESKSETEILSIQPRRVFLNGCYPQIPAQNSNWQAVIDGVSWDILGAESDSQATQTRLKVRIAQI